MSNPMLGFSIQSIQELKRAIESLPPFKPTHIVIHKGKLWKTYTRRLKRLRHRDDRLAVYPMGSFYNRQLASDSSIRLANSADAKQTPTAKEFHLSEF